MAAENRRTSQGSLSGASGSRGGGAAPARTSGRQSIKGGTIHAEGNNGRSARRARVRDVRGSRTRRRAEQVYREAIEVHRKGGLQAGELLLEGGEEGRQLR